MREKWALALAVLAVGLCFLSLLGRPRSAPETLTASGRPGAVSVPAAPDGLIDVNTAEAEDLIQIPGIGETLAQAILTEREKNGPFRLAEDLMAVRGIGKVKLAEIRPWLDLSEGE